MAAGCRTDCLPTNTDRETDTDTQRKWNGRGFGCGICLLKVTRFLLTFPYWLINWIRIIRTAAFPSPHPHYVWWVVFVCGLASGKRLLVLGCGCGGGSDRYYFARNFCAFIYKNSQIFVQFSLLTYQLNQNHQNRRRLHSLCTTNNSHNAHFIRPASAIGHHHYFIPSASPHYPHHICLDGTEWDGAQMTARLLCEGVLYYWTDCVFKAANHEMTRQRIALHCYNFLSLVHLFVVGGGAYQAPTIFIRFQSLTKPSFSHSFSFVQNRQNFPIFPFPVLLSQLK